MTQEEKELLLKDLCARLPYGIFVNENRESLDDSPTIYTFDYHPCIDNCKPYLRPMSSITKDEREEVEVLIFGEWYEQGTSKVDSEGWIEILPNYDVSGIYPEFCGDYIDWLNAHYFDYRCLIEKGLALEAPKDMYTIS